MQKVADKVCKSCTWTPENPCKTPVCMENSRGGVIVMCRAPIEARIAMLYADGHIPEPTAEAWGEAVLQGIAAGIRAGHVKQTGEI
jgi:hypothetical protein